MSTVEGFDFETTGAASGLPQALLSLAEDHGSNKVALFCETGRALGMLVVLEGMDGGAERLKAELRLDEGDPVGILVGGGTGGAGDENPAKPSSANRSCEVVSLILTIEADGWAKAKSRPLDDFRGREP
jgi:hypothetical protein